MLKTFTSRTATGLFRGACGALNGEENMRGRATMWEAPGPVVFELTDPRQSMVQVRERQLNPWVTMAEFPWLIAGRNDLAWLQRYLPRAGEFSDDGATWRAGYGPRLRAWHAPGRPHDRADQLAYVLEELRPPRTSRRAVISLWDPRTDHQLGSKDYPCCNWLSFHTRADGTVLDLTVSVRSNDLWWGASGVNWFNFSNLLRAVAEWSGLQVGSYYHMATNLHVYERHFEACRAIANSTASKAPEPADEHDSFGSEECVFTGTAVRLMRAIDAGVADWAAPEQVPAGNISWLCDWAYFMTLHPLRDQPCELADKLAAFGDRRKDWRWAAMAWATRHEDATV